MNKIFNTTPFYKIITALDYYQLLCLLCSDFPRNIVTDACKIINVHPQYVDSNPCNSENFVSSLSNEPCLFDKFELDDLQNAFEVFFYY